jgi:hypothetical protein
MDMTSSQDKLLKQQGISHDENRGKGGKGSHESKLRQFPFIDTRSQSRSPLLLFQERLS